MKNNPNITAEQIANEIKDITVDGVRYHIRHLKTRGIIIREGSTKSGKWVVLKQNKIRKYMKVKVIGAKSNHLFKLSTSYFE